MIKSFNKLGKLIFSFLDVNRNYTGIVFKTQERGRCGNSIK